MKVMSSVSTAFKVHYNQKLGDPSGHLGGWTQHGLRGDRRTCLAGLTVAKEMSSIAADLST